METGSFSRTLNNIKLCICPVILVQILNSKQRTIVNCDELSVWYANRVGNSIDARYVTRLWPFYAVHRFDLFTKCVSIHVPTERVPFTMLRDPFSGIIASLCCFRNIVYDNKLVIVKWRFIYLSGALFIQSSSLLC